MVASSDELDELGRRLWSSGVHAFAPTTLSQPLGLLEPALRRLGAWIQTQWKTGPKKGSAFPVGIHLEGPFLAASCCGAHPPEHLIDPSLKLLKKWWEVSGHTLARLTLAPERGKASEIKKILTWTRKHHISLSLGHSQATLEQALGFHRAGIRQLTHAWNAMPFHHRNPGILGAFLGKKDTFIELIPDGVHVSPEVTSWTQKLHPEGVFFVSDGVPAGMHGRSSLGNLQVTWSPGDRVCRTESGVLAGGAVPLSTLLATLLATLVAKPAGKLVWDTPWQALGLSPKRLGWKRRIERLVGRRAR